jgi:hypothetical protein
MGDDEAEGQQPPADDAEQDETTGGPDTPTQGTDDTGDGPAPGGSEDPDSIYGGGAKPDRGVEPDSIYGG